MPDTIPDASTLFAAVGAYSSPTFLEFLPFAYLIIGLLVGAGIIYGIIKWISGMLGYHLVTHSNTPWPNLLRGSDYQRFSPADERRYDDFMSRR